MFDIKLWPQLMPFSLRHDYVKQLITYGIINIVYVRSNKNLADPLTKGLSRDLVKDTSNGMGLKPFFEKNHQ